MKLSQSRDIHTKSEFSGVRLIDKTKHLFKKKDLK